MFYYALEDKEGGHTTCHMNPKSPCDSAPSLSTCTCWQRPPTTTSRKAGLDGCIQVYIGCDHLIQYWALGHDVNC
jgi:hypothetical protein